MAFEELKQRHAAMWGSAPFERVARHARRHARAVVDESRGAARRAVARRGLRDGRARDAWPPRPARTMTGADLAPTSSRPPGDRQPSAGRRRRSSSATPRQLPYEDASFDIVSSSVGAIFAPDHARRRVGARPGLQPGRRLGLTAWTTGWRRRRVLPVIAPTHRRRARAPESPRTWGDEGYCRARLGDDFELTFEHLNTPVARQRQRGDLDARWPSRSGRSRRCSAPRRRAGRGVPDELLEFFRGDADDGRCRRRPPVPARARRARRAELRARPRRAPR